jgi:hypothetical protein
VATPAPVDVAVSEEGSVVVEVDRLLSWADPRFREGESPECPFELVVREVDAVARAAEGRVEGGGAADFPPPEEW